MKQQFIFAALSLSALLFGATACNKVDEPIVLDQELITTARIIFTNTGTSQTFSYKVQNGFGSGSQGMVSIDTIRLAPNTSYGIAVQILNESKSPVEDITPEIVTEQLEHLFLYSSAPASGAGALSFSDGNKDTGGQPFNLTGTMRSGDAGSGALTLYLIHEPANKSAATAAASGGSTDVQATFPVRIQ